MPTARASGLQELEITVDSHERYAYGFSDQQATLRRQALMAGDYGVIRGGTLLATVERKSLADLVGSLTTGKLKYQLTELAPVPRAAVVARTATPRCSGSSTSVPIVFCETRKLAQEWTYRFLAAATAGADEELAGERAVRDLASASPLAPAPPTVAEVRAWALVNGYAVSDRGRVRREIVEAFGAAREGSSDDGSE